MSFHKTYEQALAKRQASDARKRSHPRKQMKRTKMVVRRLSKKATVDGSSSKAVKDELDQLVRDIIALRDHKCVTCWAHSNLHVGHLFRRGLEPVRWCLLNNSASCDPCNELHETEPEHYVGAFIQKHGEEAYNELRTQSRSKHKFTYIELLEIRDGLRFELARMKK